MRNTTDRPRFALGMMAAVTISSTARYWLFGLSLLDSLYQTVTTITTIRTITTITTATTATTATTVATVGFSEPKEFGNGENIFTIIVIIVVVSTVLYLSTLVVRVVVIDQSLDRVNDLEFPVDIGTDEDLLRLENLARSTS
jgi:FlaA1/EpsC-like NDP-sugar epimerase